MELLEWSPYIHHRIILHFNYAIKSLYVCMVKTPFTLHWKLNVIQYLELLAIIRCQGIWEMVSKYGS